MFAIPFLYLKALLFNWVGIFGILLTIAPLFQPWVEKRAMKEKVSLKHLWIAGLVCLLFASYQAWKDQHSHVDQLLRDNQTVANERDFWKDQSYQKDASLRARDQLLAENSKALNNTQQSLTDLSTKVLDVTKPEPLELTTLDLGRIEGHGNPQVASRFVDVIAITNKPISPIRLLVTCKGEITAAGGKVLGTGAVSGGGWGGRQSPHSYGIGILSPAWTPKEPLLITIHTNSQELGPCTFKEQ